MNKAIIAIGSNIQPEEKIEMALKEISQTFSVIRKSQFIFTKPVGYRNQPDFLNGSVLIQTKRSASVISKKLKEIETKLGRTRDGHPNGPRKIDLDLVLFNEQVLDEDVFEREFLQQAIKELQPDLELGK